jgi:hypothetical protein
LRLAISPRQARAPWGPMDAWIDELVDQGLRSGDERAARAAVEAFRRRALAATEKDWATLSTAAAERVVCELTGASRTAAFAAAQELLFPRALSRDKAAADSDTPRAVVQAFCTFRAARAAAAAVASPGASDLHQMLRTAYAILTLCLKAPEVRRRRAAGLWGQRARRAASRPRWMESCASHGHVQRRFGPMRTPFPHARLTARTNQDKAAGALADAERAERAMALLDTPGAVPTLLKLGVGPPLVRQAPTHLQRLCWSAPSSLRARAPPQGGSSHLRPPPAHLPARAPARSATRPSCRAASCGCWWT